MYNEIIASRLSNLTYLGTLKNSNVTAITKNNKFGDIVKFFAQINTENVLQKISFKATGCSSFLVMCSYFCEIIEGKTIDKALKISEKDLEKITKLDVSREHVYPIILDTFKLLIKKYNKGIEKGIITPCEVLTEEKVQEVKHQNKTKKTNLSDGLEDILNNKKSAKKTSQKANSLESKKEITEKIIKPSEANIIKEPKAKKEKNTATKSNEIEELIIVEPKQNEIKNIGLNHSSKNIESEEPVINNTILVVNDGTSNSEEKEHIIHVKEEIKVVETVTDNKRTVVEERKTSHLMALRQKISNKENNDKAHKNVDSLNNLLNSLNHSSINVEENSEEIKSDLEEDKNSKKTKEKKSLFSWFKKK